MIARRVLIAALFAAAASTAAGCGFRPLYAGPGYAALAGLEVETGPDRFDYLLGDAVRDFVGPGDAGPRLVVNAQLNEQSLGLSPTGEARRARLSATVSYTLHSPGAPLRGRIVDDVVYDLPGNDPYGIAAARSAAEERLAQSAAESLIAEIAARRREAAAAAPR